MTTSPVPRPGGAQPPAPRSSRPAVFLAFLGIAAALAACAWYLTGSTEIALGVFFGVASLLQQARDR